MTDLERLQAWLETYPRAGELTSYQVDYTDQLPGCFGVFPAGMVEVERTENLLGQVTVQNQYNFALYVVFAKAPGDTGDGLPAVGTGTECSAQGTNFRKHRPAS